MMQQEEKIENQNYIIRQQCVKNQLKYIVQSGETVYSTEKDSYNALEEESVYDTTLLNPMKASLEKFTDKSQKPTENPFKTIFAIIEELFEDFSFAKRMVLSEFILGTHCYSQFPSYPLLWLYIPARLLHQKVKNVFQKLCFNPVCLPSYFALDNCASLINKFTPTIIFDEISKYKIPIIESMLENPSSINSSFLSRDLQSKSLYSPKILISSKRPKSSITNHTITIPIFKINHNTKKFNGLSNLATDISKFVLSHNQDILMSFDEIKKKVDTDKKIFPILTLSRFLQIEGLLKEEEFKTMIEYLREISQTPLDYNYNQDLEILILVKEYVSSPRELSDDFYPLIDMSKFVNDNSDLINNLSPKILSQVLNKYGLILDKSRRKGTLVGEEIRRRTGKSKQITCVTLDISLLEKTTAIFN